MVVGKEIKPQEDSEISILWWWKKITSNFWRPIEVWSLNTQNGKNKETKTPQNPNLLDIV